MSTSTKVTIRRVSAHAVAAERILAELAALHGVAAPRFIRDPESTRHIARYFPPMHYADCPNGLIRLRRAHPRDFLGTLLHEFQHHLDGLAGVVCENPMRRHEPAFYIRVEALKARYTASKEGRQ